MGNEPKRDVRVLIVGLREGPRLKAWVNATQSCFFRPLRWTMAPVVAKSTVDAAERLAKREPFDLLFVAGDHLGECLSTQEAGRLADACTMHEERPHVLVGYECASLALVFRERGMQTEIGTTHIVEAVKRRTADLADKQNFS